MQTSTVWLDHPVDVVALGARSGFLWRRQGAGDVVEVLAGIGNAVEISVKRPDGADDAQQALAALSGPGELNEVGGPGTGPVAFGAFDFAPTTDGKLTVPNIVVGQGSDGRRWLTMITTESEPMSVTGALAQINEILETPSPLDESRPQTTETHLASVLSPETWRDDIVAPLTERIRQGELAKAVLARELLLTTDQPIDIGAVVQRLAASFPAAITFRVDGFVGASPELLVGRQGSEVHAHPLAGTAPRGAGPEADKGQSDGLLASTKNRWEHQITIDWLLDGLLPFCSYVDAEPEPTIVTLANLHHLGTRVEGRLSQPAASILELIGALHPTPAVGGDPRDVALTVIDQIEKADRGRYAGPVGWVDGEGNGAFAVGIRSAEINGTEARFFAGVGVVGDSDPASELAETRTKFQAMLSALLQP